MAGGSPATRLLPQIVSRLGNPPAGPGREQSVPTFPQVAPAAFLRPFPQRPGRPSRETFAGRNGGSRSWDEAFLPPAAVVGVPGRRCPPASTDVSALVSPAECVCILVWARRWLWVWMFTCVHRQTPSLCASLHGSPGCARVGACLPAPCESISGSVSLCLYVRK